MGWRNGFSDGVISCNEKKQVDLDALNLLAAGEIPELCRCGYQFELNHHRFVYEIGGLTAAAALDGPVTFNETVTLLQSAAAMLPQLASHDLAVDNVKSTKDYLFRSGSGYQFIYLPLSGKRKLTAKDFLLNVLRSVRCKDTRITGLMKDFKKLDSDDQVLYRLQSFLMQNAGGAPYAANPQFAESETSVLNEGETSLLGMQNGPAAMPQPMPQYESETSLLNEGETSLLGMQNAAPAAPQPMPQYESETSLLNEGETSLLGMQGQPGMAPHQTFSMSDTDADYFYGAVQETTHLDEDLSSEYETTVLTSEPVLPPRPAAVPNASKYRLILVRSSTGERIPVDITPFSLGKDDANMDYVIRNDSVSRYHATIIFDEGSYYIVDNHSTNGTVIEGIRLQPNERAEIGNGYYFTLGNESFQAYLERR